MTEKINVPQQFDTLKLLGDNSVESLSYLERKDGWITKVALGVIAGSAITSSVALLIPIFVAVCDDTGACIHQEAPSWAAEMLRLSLVASLAFVMGTGGVSSGGSS